MIFTFPLTQILLKLEADADVVTGVTGSAAKVVDTDDVKTTASNAVANTDLAKFFMALWF
jgi:hypothetical protein